MPQTQCYDDSLLRRFLNEQLDETDESTVIEHIDACKKCQTSLEALAGAKDEWGQLKSQLSGFDANTEATLLLADKDREMERLQEYLGPTDDPNMLGRLGAYEVCGLVGRGSTGVVVKALEPRLNRYVAIKVLSPSFSSNGPARTRFEREGRSVAAVTHPNVVPVYAVDEYRGLPFIVMQYIPGGSLDQKVQREGPLDTTEVVRLGMQVANGLAAAHCQGIVHRDVKPANVMLENCVERAMVTDFGLARVADEAAMTRSGVIAGTPQYMSPEQAKGEPVDHRSDLFSLGSVMYTACTGRAPFRAESVFGVIQRVCASQPRPIREVNPKIDEWLAAFVDKLHAKHRDDRFESASQVAEILNAELAHLQNPSSISAPSRPWLVAPKVNPAPPVKRPKKKALARTLMTLAACALLILGWQFGDGIRDGVVSIAGMGGGDWGLALAGDADGDEEDNSSEKNVDAETAVIVIADDTARTKSKAVITGKAAAVTFQLDETTARPLYQPGEFMSVKGEFEGGIVDGYQLYLPRDYDDNAKSYPVIVSLTGGCGVGGPISDLINWCLPDAIHDEMHEETDLSKYLRDGFIVVSPHMIEGEYEDRQFFDNIAAIKQILGQVLHNHRADANRIYLTGVGRGGHGTWGLACRVPELFAAAAPLRANQDGVTNFDHLVATRLPIWTGHNLQDTDISYLHAKSMVEGMEETGAPVFERIETTTPPMDEIRGLDYVFTTIDVSREEFDCDSFPNLYKSAAFFEWLTSRRNALPTEEIIAMLEESKPMRVRTVAQINVHEFDDDEESETECECQTPEDCECDSMGECDCEPGKCQCKCDLDTCPNSQQLGEATELEVETRVDKTDNLLTATISALTPDESADEDTDALDGGQRNTYKTKEEGELELRPGDSLLVESESGDIVVVTGDYRSGVKVRTECVVVAENEDDAKKLLRMHHVEYGKGSVKATFDPEFHKLRYSEDRHFKNVTMTITMPREVDLTIKCHDGDVVAGDLKGAVTIEAADGDADLKLIEGAATITLSDGDLGCKEIVGNATITCDDGDLKLGRIFGTATIVTSDGDIDAAHTQGKIVFKTDDGDIKVQRADGKIQAESEDGDIMVVVEDAKEDWLLRTSEGDIVIVVPEGASDGLDLATNDGEIVGESIEEGSRKVNIRVGDGKATITARVSEGDIELRKAAPAER